MRCSRCLSLLWTQRQTGRQKEWHRSRSRSGSGIGSWKLADGRRQMVDGNLAIGNPTSRRSGCSYQHIKNYYWAENCKGLLRLIWAQRRREIRSRQRRPRWVSVAVSCDRNGSMGRLVGGGRVKAMATTASMNNFGWERRHNVVHRQTSSPPCRAQSRWRHLRLPL